MQIYCFDQPHLPEQSLLIKAIGTTSNELADVVIKMQDHEKLQACRDCVKRAKKLNIQGTYSIFQYLSRQRIGENGQSVTQFGEARWPSKRDDETLVSGFLFLTLFLASLSLAFRSQYLRK